jgi:hypothetical protein
MSLQPDKFNEEWQKLIDYINAPKTLAKRTS